MEHKIAMEVDTSQLNDICLLCLVKPRENRVNISDSDSKKVQIAIKDLLSKEFTKDDLVPENICSTCKEKLLNAHAFLGQCHESFKIIRGICKFGTSENKEQAKTNICEAGTSTDEQRKGKSAIRAIKDHGFSAARVKKEYVVTGEPETNPVTIDLEKVHYAHIKEEFIIPHDEDSSKAGKNVNSTDNFLLVKNFDTSEETMEGKLRCKFCSEDFKCDDCFARHMQLHKDKLGILLNRRRCHGTGKEVESKMDTIEEQEMESGDLEYIEENNSRLVPIHFILDELRKQWKNSRTNKNYEPLNSCDFCPAAYKSSTGLYKHIASRHPNFEKEYDALKSKIENEKAEIEDKCHEISPNEQAAITHKDHPSSLTCKYCKAQFSFKYQLEKHEKNVHMTNLPFVCPICDVSFTYVLALKKHLNEHEKESKRAPQRRKRSHLPPLGFI